MLRSAELKLFQNCFNINRTVPKVNHSFLVQPKTSLHFLSYNILVYSSNLSFYDMLQKYYSKIYYNLNNFKNYTIFNIILITNKCFYNVLKVNLHLMQASKLCSYQHSFINLRVEKQYLHWNVTEYCTLHRMVILGLFNDLK